MSEMKEEGEIKELEEQIQEQTKEKNNQEKIAEIIKESNKKLINAQMKLTSTIQKQMNEQIKKISTKKPDWDRWYQIWEVIKFHQRVMKREKGKDGEVLKFPEEGLVLEFTTKGRAQGIVNRFSQYYKEQTRELGFHLGEKRLMIGGPKRNEKTGRWEIRIKQREKIN